MYDEFGNYIGEESPEQNIPLRDVLKNIYTGLTSEKNWRETGEGLTRLRKSIPGVSESVARGAIASVPGAIGDISEFAREWAPEVMEKKFGKERFFPTTREILDYVPRYTPTHEGASTLEDVAAFISPGVGGVTKDIAMLTKGKPLGLSIIGPESKIWNKEMAFTAGKMEAKGATPDEILEKTGMVRGLDNQWRSELSDKFAKMKQTGASFNDQYMAAKNIDPLSVFMTKAEEAKYGRSPPKLQEMSPKEYEDYLNFRSQTIDEHKALENKPVTVGDVLEHPELFEAYPHLKDVKVKVGSGHGGVKGSYNQTANEITLAAHLNPEEARSTMLHELTHGIQGKEEFNRGANAQQLTDYYKQRKQNIFNEILDLNKQRQEAYKADDMDKYRELTQARDVLSRKYGEIDPKKMGYEDYLLHGGEAEARLVQRRANLSPEELRKNFPYQFTGKTGYGLDINPDEAIITTKHPATINTPEQSIEPPTSRKDELGFHSALENAVLGIKQPKGTGEQFLKQLEKTPGVKTEELESTGLKKFLQDNPTVTKQEVQDFIEKNRVKLENKILSDENASGISPYDEYKLEGGDIYHDEEYINGLAGDLHYDMKNDPDIFIQEKEALLERYPDLYEGHETNPYMDARLNQDVESALWDQAKIQAEEMYYDNPIRHYYDEHGYDVYGNDDMGYSIKDPNGRYIDPTGGRGLYDISDVEQELRSELLDQGILSVDSEGATKYADYVLPGKHENYREILTTLPKNHQTYQLGKNNEIITNNPDYTSGHFDEPNILAHMRVDDRIINGKKTLMVEEIQSDWHQEGRKQGYKSGQDVEKQYENLMGDIRKQIYDESVARYKQEYESEPKLRKLMHDIPVDEFADRAAKTHINNMKYDDLAREAGKYDEWKKLYDDLAVERNGVPDAPFKKNWHEMMVKQALKVAADEGYDAIAFTTGKSQGERYNLAKHVDSLNLIPATSDKDYILQGWKNNESIVRKEINKDELADYVGKEVAEKLLASDLGHGVKELKGNDLSVGGQGMKGFYDKILPDYINKYTKKWGMGMKKANAEGERNLGVSTVHKAYTQAGYTKEEFDALPQAKKMEIIDSVQPKEEVHFLELTDAAKKDIKEKGQPLFAGLGAIAGADYMADLDEQNKTGIFKDLMKAKKH